jgi:hypothetical protein
LGNFLYEIKDTDEWVALPDWIECFNLQGLVLPANWQDFDEPSVVDDTWLGYYGEERYTIVDDLIIVTG